MAIYTTTNGNSPSGLKTGDYSVTSNGQVYQVLDSSKYKNMTSDQLKSAGVSYNPTTGYYSKQVTGNAATSVKNQLSASQYADTAKYQSKDTLDQWKDAYIQSQLAGLQSNYNTNAANLLKTYNQNYSDLYGQIGSAENANKKNIQELYDQTYLNNAMAMQQAANNGLTSSAQGIAMGTSGLMSASKQASQLTADKDELISNIQLKLNDLTANYNIDKNTLDANFNADKLSAMSTADLQWLQSALDIDSQNNETWNNFYATEMQNQYNTAERLAQQEYETAENDRDVERQKELLAYQYANDPSYKNYSYGGYGGYGGYSSGGSYTKSGTTSSSKLTDNEKAWLEFLAGTNIDDDTYEAAYASLINGNSISKTATTLNIPGWGAADIVQYVKNNVPTSSSTSSSSSKKSTTSGVLKNLNTVLYGNSSNSNNTSKKVSSNIDTILSDNSSKSKKTSSDNTTWSDLYKKYPTLKNLHTAIFGK